MPDYCCARNYKSSQKHTSSINWLCKTSCNDERKKVDLALG